MRLVGFRDDVDNVYGAADVVAVPSTQPDPLPNAALEAAAAGCCVVASAHGGLPEILADGVTGLLVAPGDPAALAAALAELAADPAQRERLGAAAAQDARRRFSTRAPARRRAGAVRRAAGLEPALARRPRSLRPWRPARATTQSASAERLAAPAVALEQRHRRQGARHEPADVAADRDVGQHEAEGRG